MAGLQTLDAWPYTSTWLTCHAWVMLCMLTLFLQACVAMQINMMAMRLHRHPLRTLRLVGNGPEQEPAPLQAHTRVATSASALLGRRPRCSQPLMRLLLPVLNRQVAVLCMSVPVAQGHARIAATTRTFVPSTSAPSMRSTRARGTTPDPTC